MFAEFFNLENLTTFLILTALETVLGFDNLLYISIEAKRVGEANEAYVRRMGIFLAIGLRIILLFVVLKLIELFQAPFFHFDWTYVKGALSGHSLIVLVGGYFLVRTAIKEIHHMLTVDELGTDEESNGKGKRTIITSLLLILVMNIVFSFDTVLSAIALTKNFPVMVAAIIVSGLMMVWMADAVANFLKKNRMYEVLGLFVLLLVGFMLLSEGGHLAELSFFGYAVEPMSKTTFYFVLFALVVVDVTQSRFQKKLNKAGGAND